MKEFNITMKMSLCFFDYNINFGGAPKGSAALCALLQSDGQRVFVYDVYGKNERYLNYVRSKGVPYRIVYPEGASLYLGGDGFIDRFVKGLAWFPEFIKIVSRTRAMLRKDGVHLVWVNNNKSLITVSIAAVGLKVKKVLYHRGWAEPRSVDPLFRFFIRWQCDALIGHSHATVANLKKLFPSKEVSFIPNSVEVGCKRIRNGHDRKKDFIILLPAARPVHEKGHHTAVRALRKLLDRGITQVTLHFPGEIPVGVSNKYLVSLKSLIAELGLEDRVHFIGWLDSLDDAILDANVVILPSYTEGFPRVVIESMLLKTPVIATPVGGVAEAVTHGVTGLLMRIDDADMLADSIAYLISSPEAGACMASRAYEFALTNFSPWKQLQSIKKIFKEALQNG